MKVQPDTERRQAVVICTRDRPDELRNTLTSIAERNVCSDLLVMIVDASTEPAARQTEAVTSTFTACPLHHLVYPGPPSSAAQRNYGIDHLPGSVAIVHFIDDDVTILPGYFQYLSELLRVRPEAAGVGGLILEAAGEHAPAVPHIWMKQLFLLTHPEPGRVLPSGQATAAQAIEHSAPLATQWLNGCSSYRRSVLNRFRFDASLQGYALYEDLDLSYRVSQHRPLLVEPRARLIHRASPQNRYRARRFARCRVVHRYWFVEKNIPSALGKPAFWWSVVGQALALATSSEPSAPEAFRGLLQGLRRILKRKHPLLR